MVYITERTPTHYKNRHSDWYNGMFADLAHLAGLQASKAYYLQCEREAQATLAIFNLDILGVLQQLKNFICIIKKNAYNNTYISVYDESALSACKTLEKLDGKITEIFSKIEAKAQEVLNNAVNQAQTMITKVSQYIESDIKPTLQNAQTQVTEITDQVTNVLKPAVTDAKQKADSAVYCAGIAIDQIKNKVTPQIETHKNTLTEHANKINEILAELGKEQTTPTPTEPEQPKKSLIERAIDFLI